MNKEHLITAITREAKVTRAVAKRMLDVTVAHILDTLRQGGSVRLVGLGSFHVGQRAARRGVNPHTQAPISIPAARVPRFVAGKALREIVAGGATPRGKRRGKV